MSSIISGGLAGLFLLAFLSRRANKQGLWIGISVNLLQRQTTSSLMPTAYDAAPQPIVIIDNAPDAVDITVIGNQKAYMSTNEGVNELDESFFSAGR